MKLFQGFSFLLLGLCSSFSFAAMEFKEAEITTLKNQVQHDAGTGTAPAKVNEKIGEKSKVTTAASSMAELTFADTSITRLGANSLFSFQSKERLIKLDQGSVLVNTPPGNGGATVDCGGVTGAVSGTTFMASRDVSGNVMFLMLEGTGTLKVTINTPTGPVSREIRPGQAATVGSATIKSAAAGDAVPGGGADAKNPENTSGGGEGGEKPAKAEPSIQVFDVDVKKIVETAPLIKEFKNELPSMEKIEKTIEKQQTAVREGKLEKMEVEVVAVKEDGDVLVGAPKVDPDDMKIVNRKDAPDAGLDIDTAAGPGAGDNASRPTAAVSAPPPTEAARPPLAPAPNLTGGTSGLIAGEAGGAAELPPTQLAITVQAGAVTVSFNRTVLSDRVVNLSGFAGLPGSVTILRGTSSLTLDLNPAELFPGFASNPDFDLADLTLAAASDGLTASASMIPLYPIADMQTANPVRLLLDGPKNPAVLLALDAFFYFSDKVDGVKAGPSAFNSATPATLNLLNPGHTASSAAVDLGISWTTLEQVPGEAFDFYAAGELNSFSTFNSLVTSTFINPTSNGAPTLLDLAQTTRAFFANSAKIGGALDLNGSFRKFGEGGWFGATGAVDLANGTSSPANFEMGLWDDFAGDPPGLTFNPWRTWNDEDGFLDNIANLKLAETMAPGYTPGLVVATGTDGNPATIDLDVQGLSLDASGARLEFLSAGSARVRTARFHNLQPSMGMAGAWDWSDPQMEQKAAFRLSAAEKVTMGVTPASPTSPVNEDLADRQQVRIEAIDTSSGTAPTAPASLAVIRSGQSLELRNVVIRNFAGAKLEGEAGRVLVSGSTVRDFKIKELAGLAVNTDAKIQMAVVDAGGRVAGTMQVAGGLPVDKVATGINHSVAVAEVAGVLERQMEEIKLDAKEVNLAADKIHIGSEALRTQISAQNLISLRANTVVLQNSFMSVVQNAGMINIYVQGVGDRLVNPTYGVVAQDLLNFKGINTFKIGSLSFDVHDQVSLDAARGTHIIEASGSTLPQSGKVNVLRM